MGNGHQPLQHEAAQYEDSSSTSGEEDSAIGPGQSKASASSDPASASGESTDPKNQALREGNIKSPKEQFRLLPRNHWVIYRRGCERNWVIELRSNFQKKDREQCMKKAHPRTRFLCNTETLFGPEAITHSHALTFLRQPLTAVHEYCTGRFWNVPPTEDSIFWKVMKNAPHPLKYTEILACLSSLTNMIVFARG